jgi:ankyrin repeat protein
MPTQILIIPPKLPQIRRPLGLSISNKSFTEKSNSESEPNASIGEQTKSSSENKLTIPSMRINPPQLILDSLSDCDEEDQHYGRRLTLIPRKRRKYKEPLPRIQEDEPQQASVNAIVSAPIVGLPAGLISSNTVDHTSTDSNENHGQTLLHLAARLGHEDIMRMLINETLHANTLLNSRGQTPLLCAIESGSTSTATLLMEQDPLSLTCKDNIGSSVYHYATEQRNDIVLSRAISLLKRLSSSTSRLTVS